MRLSLPYARDRRYLTGIDWTVGMLDHATRAACGLGNTSQVVVELEGTVPQDEIRDGIASFLAKIPMLHGRPARDWNLAPYWRPQAPRTEELPFTAVHLESDVDDQAVLRELAAGVHRPLGAATHHLAFLWLTVGERRAFLAMAFDHWLLDARGAEMMLSLLLEHLDGVRLDERLATLGAPAPPRLDEWQARFAAGRRINQHFLKHREGCTAALPRPSTFTRPAARFALVHFDREQTKRIVDAAYSEAGYLMVQSFVLAAIVQALHPLFVSRRLPATQYVVPATVDMRRSGAEPPVLFNHLSFLFYTVPWAIVGERACLSAHLREQMIERVKAGLPQDFCDVSDLMRIAPLSVLSRLARIPLKGELASFAFAHVASATPHQPARWDARIRNVFHMPRIPVPPAVGVVSNVFAGQLNLTVTAHEEVVSAIEVEAIAARLRALPETCLPASTTPRGAASETAQPAAGPA